MPSTDSLSTQLIKPTYMSLALPLKDTGPQSLEHYHLFPFINFISDFCVFRCWSGDVCQRKIRSRCCVRPLLGWQDWCGRFNTKQRSELYVGCKQFKMLKYCLIHSIHTLAPDKNKLLATLVVAFNDDETGNKGIARNDVVTKLAW